MCPRDACAVLCLSCVSCCRAQWVVVGTDSNWETKFHWKRIGTSESQVTVEWAIPSGTQPGSYRVRTFGNSKVGARVVALAPCCLCPSSVAQPRVILRRTRKRTCTRTRERRAPSPSPRDRPLPTSFTERVVWICV